MKPTNILIALVVALVISGVSLFFIKKAKDAKALEALGGADPATKPTGATPAAATTPVVAMADYPIIYGVKSNAAKPLQAALGVSQDGVIGAITLAKWLSYYPAVTERFRIDNATQLATEINRINAAKQARSSSYWFGW